MLSVENALEHYDLGAIAKIQPITSGIIHQTFLIEAENGTFILQNVAPIFSPIVMEDTAAVFAFLRQNGLITPLIIATKTGDYHLSDEKRFWRMFSYIPGLGHTIISEEKTARNAGTLLGTYHRILSGFDYQFKNIRAIKHNIPLLFEAYEQAMARTTAPEILELQPVIREMPGLALPTNLRICTLHGDPKISNFIFAEDNSVALAMIDFDDCGRNYNVLHEIASAIRSWAWEGGEEHPSFSVPFFTAALEGYVEGSNSFLQPEEWDLLFQAMQLNALELVSRFARDYVEDIYFDWDRKQYASRREHNLVRARGHVAWYRCLKANGQNILGAITRLRR